MTHHKKVLALPISQVKNTKAIDALEKYIRKHQKNWFSPKTQDKSPLSGAMQKYLKHITQPSVSDIKVFFQIMFKALNSSQKLELLSRDLIGNKETKRDWHPLGDRLALYADWTASGRGLNCFKQVFEKMKPFYANSHTEDTEFGKYMTELLHDADETMLDSVNAPESHYFPITSGTGSSGPAFIIQNILGIFLSSQAKSLVLNHYQRIARPDGPLSFEEYKQSMGADLPTVIVSPMEHHTSINPYKDGLSELQMCALDKSGKVDYTKLEAQIRKEMASKNTVIVSLSAGSNVSGVLLDLDKVKTMVQKIRDENPGKKLVLGIDFAAVHGYKAVDMSDTVVDFAIFSPHKLAGGEGSTGVGIFKTELYKELCPLPASGSGGGTV